MFPKFVDPAPTTLHTWTHSTCDWLISTFMIHRPLFYFGCHLTSVQLGRKLIQKESEVADGFRYQTCFVVLEQHMINSKRTDLEL